MSELEKFKLHYEYNETNSELRKFLRSLKSMSTTIKTDLIGKETKPKQKKENQMNSTKKTAIVSVVSTLAVIIAIGAIFYGGIKFEQNRQDVIAAQATELAGKLKQDQR